MKELDVVVEILENGQLGPKDHSKTIGNLMIDVKMELTRKAHRVLNSHRSISSEGSTHESAVPRESVRIAFSCLALNEVEF